MEQPFITHIVLDVLKAHQPPLPEFAAFVGELGSIKRVDVTVVEMDEKTESLKVTIDAAHIDYEELRSHMAKQGAVIHSVDQVVVE